MSEPLKSALITGGANRVGKAIVEDLAAAGYAVAVHYNSSKKQADALVAEILSAGGKACAVDADLTDEAATRAVIADACQQIGPLDLLVNNASVFVDDKAGDNADLWKAHFDVHVRAPSILTQAFADQLPDDTDGLIVNMIDQRVLKPNPNFHSYTLSKSALWTATRTMAQAFAPSVRVNAIGPGPTLPSERQTQAQFDQQVACLPLKRAPELSAFAQTILYFASSPSVTGQMIALDGGQHLAWETDDLKVQE